MIEKKVFGHIDCPHCGYKAGMRITADKKGAPFGFCEANCDGQLRIGGKPRRVEQFFKTYPHIAAAMQQKPVTVTAPETSEKPVTEQQAEAEIKPIVKPEPAKKSGFSMDDLK